MEPSKKRAPTPTKAAAVPASAGPSYKEVAWAIEEAEGEFKPIYIDRANVAEGQVRFEMLYAGICHTDLHIGRGQTPFPVQYPFVGGHELLGKVVEVGTGVTKVKVGDHVTVGCFVESCLNCEFCKDGDEQYCDKMTQTYNDVRKTGHHLGDKETTTKGGYSGSNTVHEKFVCKVPEGMDLAKTAPLVCAGITMYDPLRHWGYTKTKGKTVGIIGIGGLGTMGIKLAKALGHKVVAIARSADKEAVAKAKGADTFVASTSEESMKAAEGTCDLILNTVPVNHDVNFYLPLVAKSGVIV